jgi:hypothetical protein
MFGDCVVKYNTASFMMQATSRKVRILTGHLSSPPLNTLNHPFYFCYRKRAVAPAALHTRDKYTVQLIHLFFLQAEIQSHP